MVISTLVSLRLLISKYPTKDLKIKRYIRSLHNYAVIEIEGAFAQAKFCDSHTLSCIPDRFFFKKCVNFNYDYDVHTVQLHTLVSSKLYRSDSTLPSIDNL